MTATLTGEIALVTGASRGIGQAIALELATQGALVVGTATTEAGAKAIALGLEQTGHPGAGRILDVTAAQAIEALVEEVSTRVGPITILVNNAGMTRDQLVMRMRNEDWEVVIQTNLSAVFRLTKTCLRGMLKARRGRVINITSVVGVMGNAGQANYAAAKAGVIGLTKSVAREVGTRGITVNAVAPGFIDTDMTRALPEAQRQALLNQIPVNRLGRTEEVAKAVAFLASPAAAYITGETLHVNGGLHMP